MALPCNQRPASTDSPTSECSVTLRAGAIRQSSAAAISALLGGDSPSQLRIPDGAAPCRQATAICQLATGRICI